MWMCIYICLFLHRLFIRYKSLIMERRGGPATRVQNLFILNQSGGPRKGVLIPDVAVKKTLCQTIFVVPSFNFMKFRKKNHEKIPKIFPFFDIKFKLWHISIFGDIVPSI